MSPQPRPAYPPSLGDWEDYRPIIKQLYVDEGRNLSEVQQTLCKKYHFKASLRSYKNKLRSWGLRKYYRAGTPQPHPPGIFFDPDSAALSTFSGQFSPGYVKDEDDDAATGLSQPISPAPTESGRVSQDPVERGYAIPTPQQDGQELIQRRLGSASPLPCVIMTDDINDSTESIVIATKAFITAITDLTTPMPSPSDTLIRQIRPFRRRKNYIWHQFQHSLTLFEQGSIQNAFENLQKGCSMAEGYLTRPSRQTLMSLLMVMGNRRWSRHQQVWMSVVRFMASMSSRALGPRHPLTHILSHIRNWDLMRAVAQPAMRVIRDIYSKKLGSGHPESLLLKQSLSVELMREGDFDRSESLIQEACEVSGAIYGQSSLARRNCLRRLGNLYVEQQRWTDAEGVFEKVLALDSEANLYQGPTEETSVFTCQNLSFMHCQKGDLSKSEYWAEQELDLALKIYGPKDDYYAECLKRRTARLNGEPSEKWFSWLEVS